MRRTWWIEWVQGWKLSAFGLPRFNPGYIRGIVGNEFRSWPGLTVVRVAEWRINGILWRLDLDGIRKEGVGAEEEKSRSLELVGICASFNSDDGVMFWIYFSRFIGRWCFYRSVIVLIDIKREEMLLDYGIFIYQIKIMNEIGIEIKIRSLNIINI